MGMFEDMALLVEVVEIGGLAAAGRRLKLSPSTMSMRLKALEERYKTRLFNRSTRAISLTRAGEDFYHAALRVLEEMQQAETKLTQKEGILSGSLRISAPSDFGRQYLSPALLEFSKLNHGVNASLLLSDSVLDLVDFRLDVSIRYGNLPDSNLIKRVIKPSYRVLVASRDYLNAYGTPEKPEDLIEHRCLMFEQLGRPMNEWRFEKDGRTFTPRINAALLCDDGKLLREWAIAGAGITCKSWWDVKEDIKKGHLVVILPDSFLGFSHNDNQHVGLQFVYPQRNLQPEQVTVFSQFFIDWMDKAVIDK